MAHKDSLSFIMSKNKSFLIQSWKEEKKKYWIFFSILSFIKGDENKSIKEINEL